jgi:hypothetical protein
LRGGPSEAEEGAGEGAERLAGSMEEDIVEGIE